MQQYDITELKNEIRGLRTDVRDLIRSTESMGRGISDASSWVELWLGMIYVILMITAALALTR